MAAPDARLDTAHRRLSGWRLWLVLSRIAAENGRADAAVAAYREARSLNPRGEIFER